MYCATVAQWVKWIIFHLKVGGSVAPLALPIFWRILEQDTEPQVALNGVWAFCAHALKVTVRLFYLSLFIIFTGSGSLKGFFYHEMSWCSIFGLPIQKAIINYGDIFGSLWSFVVQSEGFMDSCCHDHPYTHRHFASIFQCQKFHIPSVLLQNIRWQIPEKIKCKATSTLGATRTSAPLWVVYIGTGTVCYFSCLL